MSEVIEKKNKVDWNDLDKTVKTKDGLVGLLEVYCPNLIDECMSGELGVLEKISGILNNSCEFRKMMTAEKMADTLGVEIVGNKEKKFKRQDSVRVKGGGKTEHPTSENIGDWT